MLNAQDTIVLKNNSKLLVKVSNIGLNEINYSNYFNDEGTIYNINKIDVDYIAYANGNLQKIDTPNAVAVNEAPKDLYFRGQKDAGQFYTGYQPAGTGTLVVSLLSPLVGLIPAVACSTTPPKRHNLEFPDSNLFQNPDYQNGYIKEAKKIKSRKVWKNWAIAFGVNIALVLVLQN